MNYALVNIHTLEVIANFMGAMPDRLVWPNGDATYAVSPGEERAGYRFVSVDVTPDKPSEFHGLTGTKPDLGEFVLTYVQSWSPIGMDQVRPVLNGRIDAAAETERLKYITAGAGQALTYQAKLAEAQAFQANGGTDYPLLNASMAPGQSLADVASSVIAASQQWTVVAACIEKIRLDAKARIASAMTVEEASAIVGAVSWEG